MRLADAPFARLALIVAPAGYGKSTLLAEWASCDQRPFVWVTAEPGDDDGFAAATSLAEAFEDMGWVDPGAWPALTADATGDALRALRALMRSADVASRSFVLVLDDAHVIPPRVLGALIPALLSRLGRDSRLAIASRSEPLLPVGRLRAHRALVEVRAEDLAMGPAHARALLRHAGLELEPATVRSWYGLAEGWPAGLYLAALAMRRQRGISDAGSRFHPDDHLLADYVRDEFLSELAPEEMRFVMRSSVLDELTGPMCDAVLARRGSAGMLAELANGNLMLVALDRRRERYRWHGVFAAALQAELRRIEPDIEASLHTRASDWLARHGDLDGAIAHAVAACDAVRAGDLLWANAAAYLAGGSLATVEAWLERFSREQLGACVPLALTMSHCRLMAGSIDEARHWSLIAGEAEAHSLPGGTTPSCDGALAIIDAAAGRMGPAQMARDASRAYECEPDNSSWRPVCCLLAGVAEHLGGNHERARLRLEEGVDRSGVDAPGIGSLCLAQLAIIAIERDDWDLAADLTDRAAKIIKRHPALADYAVLALVFAVCAATGTRAGRVDEAKRDLGRGLHLLTSLGEFSCWYGAETRILLARAAMGLADTVRARTLLAEASRLARRMPDAPIFTRWLDEAWAHIDTLAEAVLTGPSSLTIAELRILRFLPSHRSFREIAERLDVSVNTVKTQVHAIYRKLGATSRSEAVQRASSAGLLGS